MRCINRTEEETTKSYESDETPGLQKRGENQISYESGNVSNDHEDADARGSATKKSISVDRLYLSRVDVSRVNGYGR